MSNEEDQETLKAEQIRAAQIMLVEYKRFVDAVVISMASNPQVLDKNAHDNQFVQHAFRMADALWAERVRRLSGQPAPEQQPQQQMAPYTGVPIAVPGQMFPQMPTTPSGIPAVAPVPGFNAMHQVDTKNIIAHQGGQGHPYGPTVLATDMKGANISAQNPAIGGPPAAQHPMARPGQGEPRVLATDMQGAHASAQNPIPGT